MLDQFVKMSVPAAAQETQTADVVVNDDKIMEAGGVDEAMTVDE
jgi:hypothetical protein